MAAVTFHNVFKQFGPDIVLQDVSIDLQKGQITGLVGDNGSGKTTLMKLIIGHLKPEIGAITREKGLDIGFLPQEPELALEKSIHDEVGSAFANLLSMEKKLHALSDEIAALHDDPKLPELMEAYHQLD